MCDKKNNVLYTDTECLVLSSYFKLPDASQVLLRVPRENNMYNVNLKNIIPSGDLTCLFVKATLDESNLWHRRLGHVNFKTINKLVKGNLVRGLPFKTPYELLHGRLPSIGFMRPFGCPVTILNTLDPLGKFQGKVDEGFLVGYSVCSKAYRVFNSRARIVQETLHVNFMKNKPNVTGSSPAWLFDIYSLSHTMNYHPVLAENQSHSNAGFQDTENAGEEGTQSEQGDKAENKDKGKSPIITITRFRDLNEEFAECINNSSNGVNATGSSLSAAELNFTNSTNDFSADGPSNAAMPNLEDLSHNVDDVGAEADINNMESIISTRSMARGVRDQGGISQMFNEDFHTCMFACFLSQEDPKRVHQALKDLSWIEAMQKELIQFKMQKVWILVDLPYGKRAIVYQMDVKSAFLCGTIEEEVYVCQPPGFEDPEYPDKVYKVVKALYGLHQAPRACVFLYGTIEEEVYVCQPPGFEDPDYPDKVYKVVKVLYSLHQAPRAWYETLATCLLENGFHKRQMDQTLFIKKQKGDIQLVQIYVDDIIFGATNKDL
nr:hypothetical protein [Tanacetum cinerariifolium]